MTSLKPSSHGIVVDHKESNVRYAISDSTYDSRIHTKVRDLRPGETIFGFKPLARTDVAGSTITDVVESPAPQTEGSSTEGTKGK